eukprot:GHVR01047794.1.p1 GENE.GHVR01047794.1~~GHVR01047794.1.p1  ORF type:complete len:278 (-),score=104.87 GHVR01047794.1:230-1063(-)
MGHTEELKTAKIEIDMLRSELLSSQRECSMYRQRSADIESKGIVSKVQQKANRDSQILRNEVELLNRKLSLKEKDIYDRYNNNNNTNDENSKGISISDIRDIQDENINIKRRLSDTLKENERRVSIFNKNINELMLENEQLKAKVVEKDIEIASLKNRLLSTEGEVDTLNDKNRNISNKLKEIELNIDNDDIYNNKDNYNKLDILNKQLQSKIDDNNNEINQLNKRIYDIKEELEDVNMELNVSKARCNTYEAQSRRASAAGLFIYIYIYVYKYINI